MNTDQTTEQAIQAAGATVAPRLTPDGIESEIIMEVYQNSGDDIDGWTFGKYKSGSSVSHEDLQMASKALSLLTICVLVLRNGHTVTGESHCQDLAKFDAQIGRDEARKDAINKLWPMAVYAAREKEISEMRWKGSSIKAQAVSAVCQQLGSQAATALNQVNASRPIDGAGDVGAPA